MRSVKLLISLCMCVFLAGPALAQGKRLPPTSMDSFVRQASGNAEMIYGDEGHEGPPPFYDFQYENRINSGIYDRRDAGLTTGHGSKLPSAWGRDEFLGAEWSRSGANRGNPNPTGPGRVMDERGNPQDPRNIPPYQIGPDWIMVRNPDTGQIMGYMQPGETYQDFFSGRSGHILAQWADVGRELLNNPEYRGRIPTGPVTSGAGF